MKKVLFATTALVATAGVAAADVTLSGSAEMGIYGGDTFTAATPLLGTGAADGRAASAASASAINTQFHQDIEVTFGLSGQTDNGLTFGASIQLDEAAWTDSSDDGGTSVFISGAFGTLTMGDTDGGFDWGMYEVPTGSGSINDAETSHAGWNGFAGLDGTHDGQVLRYDYTMGGFGIAVSYEIDDAATATSDDNIGIGLRYVLQTGGATVSFGAGYQTGADTVTDALAAGALLPGGGGFNAAADSIVTVSDVDVIGVSVNAAFNNGLSVGAAWSNMDGTATATTIVNGGAPATVVSSIDTTHWAIGAAYTMDALTVGVNYGEYDRVGTAADTSGFGISAGYDLGGGASILAGYSHSDRAGTALDTDLWSLGLSMSF